MTVTSPAELIRERRQAEQTLRANTLDAVRRLADALDTDVDLPRIRVSGSVFATTAEQARTVLALGTVTEWEIKTYEPKPQHRFIAKVYVGETPGGIEITLWADPEWVCDATDRRTVEVANWTFQGAPAEVPS